MSVLVSNQPFVPAESIGASYGVGNYQSINITAQLLPSSEGIRGVIKLQDGTRIPITPGWSYAQNSNSEDINGIDYSDGEGYKFSNSLVWTNKEVIDLKDQTPSFFRFEKKISSKVNEIGFYEPQISHDLLADDGNSDIDWDKLRNADFFYFEKKIKSKVNEMGDVQF